VPGGGVEPPWPQGPADFESAASASSAIPALLVFISITCADRISGACKCLAGTTSSYRIPTSRLPLMCIWGEMQVGHRYVYCTVSHRLCNSMNATGRDGNPSRMPFAQDSEAVRRETSRARNFRCNANRISRGPPVPNSTAVATFMGMKEIELVNHILELSYRLSQLVKSGTQTGRSAATSAGGGGT
jgi:hypothetical protein